MKRDRPSEAAEAARLRGHLSCVKKFFVSPRHLQSLVHGHGRGEAECTQSHFSSSCLELVYLDLLSSFSPEASATRKLKKK